LIGGVDPSADPSAFFSAGHYQHVAESYPDLVQLIAQKRIIFVDSITEPTGQGMAWAKTRPEAFSEKTGKPDVRGIGRTSNRGPGSGGSPAAASRPSPATSSTSSASTPWSRGAVDRFQRRELPKAHFASIRLSMTTLERRDVGRQA
jgi:hypothetical protein